MTGIRRFLVGLFMALCVALPSALPAQEMPEVAQRLRQAEAEVREVEKRAETADLTETDGAILRTRLAVSRESASSVADVLSKQLTALDARIAELGPAPEGQAEAPEVRRQRANLATERMALDAMVKRARLLDVEAEQLGAEMQRRDAKLFGNRMAQRDASPLTLGFWGRVIAAFDKDIGRINRFLSDGKRQAQEQGQQRTVWFAILGVVLAVLLLGPGRHLALSLGQSHLVTDMPGGRVRRSAYAFWLIIVGTLLPFFASIVLVQGASLSHLLPPNWEPLLLAFMAASAFSGFIAGVFGALLMHRQPSWRIAPIPDDVANRLRPLAWILAGISFVGAMIDAFNSAIGASEAALAASTVLQTAGSLVLIGGALFVIGRIQASEATEDGPTSSAGMSALALVLWLVLAAAAVALAIGYAQLSDFLVTMIVLATVLGAFTYLLMCLIDDVSTSIFSRSSRLGATLVRGVGVSGSAVDQFGVALSGVLRVMVGFVALVLLLAPFGAGSGVGSILGQITSIADGIDIGGVAVSPGAIVRGIVVLFVGLALVRGFTGWLDNRYLPATDLDGSGRNSVSLVARYIGIALAAIWGLASLGIGIERVALLLSALSVGIGFGLQAITQNFISGLILLAERPIKIGDLIKVGNDEGDVKRISVRSTELRLADHSTLIIPNSELITKPVLNKTLANPLGRLQIQFSVPIEADAARVEDILLGCYASEAAVLKKPPPSVFIDSIVDGRMLFNSFAHVASPRASYAARSNVFKALLRRLREEEIEIGSPPQTLQIVEGSRSGTADAAPREPREDDAI